MGVSTPLPPKTLREVTSVLAVSSGLSVTLICQEPTFPPEWTLKSVCSKRTSASKEVWFKIKGFEEELIYPLYADTNVQKKAKISGYELTGQFEPPLFHINHGTKGWGGGGFAEGINKKANDINRAITNQNESLNKDTWGFSNINIETETF